MTDETWPCRACGMSLRDCTEEPDPLGVCCSACGQAARGNHREYEWTCEGHGCGVCALCTQPKPENEPTQAALSASEPARESATVARDQTVNLGAAFRPDGTCYGCRHPERQHTLASPKTPCGCCTAEQTRRGGKQRG